MPLSDDFLLTQLTVDFVDGPRSRARLYVDPDDVRGRGLDVTFLNVRDVVDMTDATVMLYWQHDQAPALRGLEPFEAVDARTGHWKVHYPPDMGASGGTVSAKIMVGQDGDSIAVPLPTIAVNGIAADPSATPTGDNFSILGELVVEYQKGIADITDLREASEEATGAANAAAADARAAAEETRTATQDAKDATAETEAATQAATDAKDSAYLAANAANTAASNADEKAALASAMAGKADGAADRATASADRADASADAADAATSRANASADAADAKAALAQSKADLADAAAESANAAAGRAETGEDAREAAEAGRVAAEAARAEAEEDRESYYTGLRASVDAGDYDGATFTPSVAENGDLTWANDKGRENPPLVNVRGPRGEGLNILDAYASLEELEAAHPEGGDPGDGYMVGDRYFTWNGFGWVDCGELRGPKGDTGDSAGPLWLEVDEAGDLWAYYDDNFGAPNLDYDEASGDLYAIFETEA